MVTFTTVIIYEALKIWLNSKKKAKQAFLGIAEKDSTGQQKETVKKIILNFGALILLDIVAILQFIMLLAGGKYTVTPTFAFIILINIVYIHCVKKYGFPEGDV
jgi:hypothetical protein